jgi:signal transduction histidine kinase
MEVHGPMNEQQRGAIDRIATSQRHLLRLVNEVLNLARIEAGHVDFSITRVSLRTIVEDVRPMIEPQMGAAALAFTSDVPDDLMVLADRGKAEQVLINLLTNAVKFTPAGGRVTLRAQAAGADRALLHVSDTGIGISGDKLAGVFEPFVQVRPTDGRSQEGTGLGLSISRDLARGMGGDLTAESTPGQGSTFTLLLRRG